MERALQLFFQVSREYPASAVAQGTAMAKGDYRDNTELIPELQKLARDADVLRQVVRVASAGHAAAKVKTPEITELSAQVVLSGVSGWGIHLLTNAKNVKVFDAILALYPQYRHPEDEEAYQAQAQHILFAGLTNDRDA